MGILLNCSFLPFSFVEARNTLMFGLNKTTSVAGELADAKTASISCQQLSLFLTADFHL